MCVRARASVCESEYMYGIYVNLRQLFEACCEMCRAPGGSFALLLFLFFISKKKKRPGGAMLALLK